jgi:hypothetical protein
VFVCMPYMCFFGFLDVQISSLSWTTTTSADKTGICSLQDGLGMCLKHWWQNLEEEDKRGEFFYYAQQPFRNHGKA